MSDIKRFLDRQHYKTVSYIDVCKSHLILFSYMPKSNVYHESILAVQPV